ncbi:hypothetical protein [Brenneria corticis]|uniref:Uncharacterized protein n=1 Tax=Brenneria corticis TaxID=2173106 RepID=A0A2U1TJP5_9GAMM|nr:hypothetical protein [Brenneria sp. CFCC 11842]PWC09640.1 hypothetical protein DDT56_23450 [Brenneria sp. CFCC 11842]
MSSTAFIICLILAAVMITVHPVFAMPFGIAALVITSKSKMHMDSEVSIIFGIVGFILFLALVMCIRNWLR